MTLKCLKEKTLRADDWGLEWSAATALSAESSVKPVMFPEARTSSVWSALVDLAYYKEQRTYLQDSMAKSKTCVASGIVTKTAVRNKVEKLLRGLIPEAKQLQGMPPMVKDGLSAQFCQAKPDSHRWNFSTDFHMPLCIMCLEGELLCNGSKRPESSSAVNSELVLMSQSGADDWAEKLEWQCLLTPGKNADCATRPHLLDRVRQRYLARSALDHCFRRRPAQVDRLYEEGRERRARPEKLAFGRNLRIF